MSVLDRRRTLLIFAAWTALGLLESARGYVVLRDSGNRVAWWWALVVSMPWWYGWAALTPVAFSVASRWPMTVARWGRPLLVHVVSAGVLALAHLTCTAVLTHWLTRGRTLPRFREQFPAYLANYFVIDLVIYAAIVGAYFALEYARRWRESTLAAGQLETRATRLELGLAEARIQALRMELNPHFLFNTLNAISGLVRKQQTDAAVNMLARLGDLLRVTLDRELPRQISLDDELTLLQHYLDIEKARFGTRLEITLDIDPATRGALVPTLISQPLVENAVRHGVSRRSGTVAVSIRAWTDGTVLQLEIRDTGRGLGPLPVREGIGISNTRARLDAMYGSHATLQLGDWMGGGTLATVRIPFQEAERHAHVPASA
jgi:two-component system, LytTR family, sensor kinase